VCILSAAIISVCPGTPTYLSEFHEKFDITTQIWQQVTDRPSPRGVALFGQRCLDYAEPVKYLEPGAPGCCQPWRQGEVLYVPCKSPTFQTSCLHTACRLGVQTHHLSTELTRISGEIERARIASTIGCCQPLIAVRSDDAGSDAKVVVFASCHARTLIRLELLDREM